MSKREIVFLSIKVHSIFYEIAVWLLIINFVEKSIRFCNVMIYIVICDWNVTGKQFALHIPYLKRVVLKESTNSSW